MCQLGRSIQCCSVDVQGHKWCVTWEMQLLVICCAITMVPTGKHKVLRSTQGNVSGNHSRSSIHCLASHIWLKNKTEKGKCIIILGPVRNSNRFLGILTDCKDTFHGASMQMLMGKSWDYWQARKKKIQYQVDQQPCKLSRKVTGKLKFCIRSSYFHKITWQRLEGSTLPLLKTEYEFAVWFLMRKYYMVTPWYSRLWHYQTNLKLRKTQNLLIKHLIASEETWTAPGKLKFLGNV